MVTQKKPSRVLDPQERAREKQASRADDEEALRSGALTQDQLREKNSFLKLPGAKIKLDKATRLA